MNSIRIILLLLLFTVVLCGCQQQTVTEISLYKMTSYTSSETGSLRTITNEEEIKVFIGLTFLTAHIFYG